MLPGHKGFLRGCVVAVALAALVMAFAPSAFGVAQEPLTDIGTTINQTSGAKPTRFTFTAQTTAEVESIKLTFPEGFTVHDAAANAVVLEGLTRLPVDVTQSIEGSSIELSFIPPVQGASNLRVQIIDVLPPPTGGTYTLQVDAVSQGQAYQAETPAFIFNAVTTSEQISAWLDSQPWVTTWNSIDFLRLFARPQQIAIAVPLLFRGWIMSIALIAFAFPLAIVGGLALAFMKMARLAIVRGLASVYINVIRGTPLFLQIFIAFIGLPIAGIRAPLYVTGVIVLALNSSAYLAEIFRAGIQSIHRGQMEAASSLGMSYPHAMAYVIIPQTVKRVLPTMTSEFILLFKDTALLSAVGVFELMLYSRTLATRTGNLTPFVVAAGYYLLVTIPLINWVASLEQKLAISEGGQAATTANKLKRGLWRGLSRTELPAETAEAPASPDEGGR